MHQWTKNGIAIDNEKAPGKFSMLSQVL